MPLEIVPIISRSLSPEKRNISFNFTSHHMFQFVDYKTEMHLSIRAAVSAILWRSLGARLRLALKVDHLILRVVDVFQSHYGQIQAGPVTDAESCCNIESNQQGLDQGRFCVHEESAHSQASPALSTRESRRSCLASASTGRISSIYGPADCDWCAPRGSTGSAGRPDSARASGR
jgi:hypothetical protein